MHWVSTLLLSVGLAAAVGAEETTQHQRVGMRVSTEHRWEGGLDVGLTPWTASSWEVTLAPTLSYEYARTWGLSFSVPYRWTTHAELPLLGEWQSGTMAATWTGPGEPRWKAGVSWSALPWWQKGAAPWIVSGQLAASVVRDPVVWGVGGFASVPLARGTPDSRASGWSGGLSFSYQEVANDSWAWNLALSPRWVVPPGGPSPGKNVQWSVGVTWGTGWYEVPWSVSAGVGSGSGIPWSLTAQGTRSW